jgi:hypothetical protein
MTGWAMMIVGCGVMMGGDLGGGVPPPFPYRGLPY